MPVIYFRKVTRNGVPGVEVVSPETLPPSYLDLVNWDQTLSGLYGSYSSSGDGELMALTSLAELTTHSATYKALSLSEVYTPDFGYKIPAEINEESASSYFHRFVFVPAEPITATTISVVTDQYDTLGLLQMNCVYSDGTRSQFTNNWGSPDFSADYGDNSEVHLNTFYLENKQIAFIVFTGAYGYPQGAPNGVLEIIVSQEELPPAEDITAPAIWQAGAYSGIYKTNSNPTWYMGNYSDLGTLYLLGSTLDNAWNGTEYEYIGSGDVVVEGQTVPDHFYVFDLGEEKNIKKIEIDVTFDAKYTDMYTSLAYVRSNDYYNAAELQITYSPTATRTHVLTGTNISAGRAIFIGTSIWGQSETIAPLEVNRVEIEYAGAAPIIDYSNIIIDSNSVIMNPPSAVDYMQSIIHPKNWTTDSGIVQSAGTIKQQSIAGAVKRLDELWDNSLSAYRFNKQQYPNSMYCYLLKPISPFRLSQIYFDVEDQGGSALWAVNVLFTDGTIRSFLAPYNSVNSTPAGSATGYMPGIYVHYSTQNDSKILTAGFTTTADDNGAYEKDVKAMTLRGYNLGSLGTPNLIRDIRVFDNGGGVAQP